MKQSNLTLKLGLMAALLGVAMPVFAESAPVYEVDELDQGAAAAQSQRDVLPPAPSSPEESFSANASPEVQVSAAPSSGSSSSSDVNQRLRKLEQKLNSVAQTSSSEQVESLQSQIQTLRNQVEQLTHALEKAQAEQKAAYTDLDTRLAQANAAPAQAAVTPPPPAAEVKPAAKTPAAPKVEHAAKKEAVEKTEGPDVAEEQQIYQSAYTLIKDKKYDEAVTTLQTMLKKYPTGQFASNAHYWLGELYGLLGKSNKSLGEFVIVVTNYSKSPRVSDAQLKIGLIFASQDKWLEAKSAFKKVVDKYPGTASARLASEQLKQIKTAGH
jgi:tol-pal system protein YbgF